MKTLTWMALACWMTVCAVAAEEEQWMTDLPKAEAKAKAEKKLVLMDFTGSDWCHPCMALHKNVLTSPEFEAYAKTNLELVVVDFPQSKPQTEELRKANDRLKDQFRIEGFPTIILLDPNNGKELHRSLGYSGESPKEFIAKLDKAKQKGS